MTVLKKLNFLLLAAAIVSSCEDPLPEPIVPPPGTQGAVPFSQYFEATVDFNKVSGTPVEYEPVISLAVQYEGTGSSNMMSRVSINANHIEEAFPNHQRWDLRQGQFVITGDEGNSIYGTYSGFGFNAVTGNNLTWLFTIQGGTGKFTSARGKLTAQIHELNGISVNNRANITGQIDLPDHI